MKKSLLTHTLLILAFYVNAQNVGIGTNVPKSKLDVNGNTSIGSTYSGTNAAPTNGAIIEGVVGIGTPTPDASAQLDVTSTSTPRKGFLPPRVTVAQMNAIASPAQGLIVFETDCNNLYVYKGTSWRLIQTPVTPITTTYNYAGSTIQSFVVPTCVYSVEVQVWGAGGGGSGNGLGPVISGSLTAWEKGSAGGGGGYVNANIKVTPGTTLYISVGQGGSLSTVAGTTSYGGGGSTNGTKSAYGGGCSAILSANALTQANSLVVAGGGGGAGYNRSFGNILGGGGSSINAAGVATPEDGNLNGNDPTPCASGYGKGGSTLAGGLGGVCSASGTNGVAIQGGIGALSGTCYNSLIAYTTEGGGGGGGYFGGGGGGVRVGASPGTCDYDSGGGGGGSSYINTSTVSLIESAAGEYGSNTSGGPGGVAGGSGRKNYSNGIGNGGNGYFGPVSQTGKNGRVVIIYQ